MNRLPIGSCSMRFFFVGLLLLVVNGCGLLLVRPPPSGHEQMDQFNCTETNVGPILDVLTAMGGVVVMFVAQDDYYYFVQPQMIAGGAITAVFSGVSAAVGFRMTERCRLAKEQLEERLNLMQQNLGDTLAVVHSPRVIVPR